jgi:hypothetical protein
MAVNAHRGRHRRSKNRLAQCLATALLITSLIGFAAATTATRSSRPAVLTTIKEL